MDAGDTGEGKHAGERTWKTHTTHEHTRYTQVRGPREEVTPLLLPVSLSYSEVSGVTSSFTSYTTHTNLYPEEEEALRESLGFL